MSGSALLIVSCVVNMLAVCFNMYVASRNRRDAELNLKHARDNERHILELCDALGVARDRARDAALHVWAEQQEVRQ